MKNSIMYLGILILFFPFLINGQQVSWSVINTGTNKNINDIYFVNPDTGYIVGDDYLFRKTTDGGATWQDLPTPSIGERPGNSGNILAIDFHSSPSFSNLSSGLILTWEKLHFPVITEDEGGTYKHFPPIDSSICQASGFSVMPLSNGYTQLALFGKSCLGKSIISKYLDGPFSTFFIDSTYGSKGSFTTIASNDSLTIAGHENGNLLSYPPFSFIKDTFSLDTSGVDVIAYAGNDTWYASTSRLTYNMYISTDNGASFKVDSSFFPTFYYPNFRDMDFLRNGKGLAGGIRNNPSYGCIFIQNGNQWSFYPADHAINAVKAFPNGMAYAAGDSGLFMKTQDFATGVKQNKDHQNQLNIFPNPAQEMLFLEKTDRLKVYGLRLYSINGRFIRAFPEQETSLNVSNLPRNIYLLEIRTSQGIIMKKVVISK